MSAALRPSDLLLLLAAGTCVCQQIDLPYSLPIRPLPWYVPQWRFPDPASQSSPAVNPPPQRKLFARPAAMVESTAGAAVAAGQRGSGAVQTNSFFVGGPTEWMNAENTPAPTTFKSYFPTSMQRSLDFYQPRNAGEVDKGPFDHQNDPYGFKKAAGLCGSMFSLDQSGMLKKLVQENKIDYSWVRGKKDLAPLLAMASYVFFQKADPFDTWPSIFMLLAAVLVGLNMLSPTETHTVDYGVDCGSLKAFQEFRGVNLNDDQQTTQSLTEYYFMWDKIGRQPSPADFSQFFREGRMVDSSSRSTAEQLQALERYADNLNPEAVPTDELFGKIPSIPKLPTDGLPDPGALKDAAMDAAKAAAAKHGCDKMPQALRDSIPECSNTDNKGLPRPEGHTLQKQRDSNKKCADPHPPKPPGLLSPVAEGNFLDGLDACIVM